MCLILFANQVHPIYKLVVAANRDEFYQRPTAHAQFWEDDPNILAGRDLEKMGTWMGITRQGCFSALTNYRDPKEEIAGKRSRGELVAQALKYKGEPEEYLKALEMEKHLFSGYNLLVGNSKALYYYSNIGKKIQKIERGIHGLSNHFLNTNWPKVEKGKLGMSDIIRNNEGDMIEDLFRLLQSSDPFSDNLLPKTGVSLDLERMLSPLFIKSKDYGTRSSTVLLMSDKEVHYVERVYQKEAVSENKYKIELGN